MPSAVDPRHLSSSIHFALLPEQANEMLRLLSVTPVDWQAVAEPVLHSPGLLCTLFLAIPHDGSRLDRHLRAQIVSRLEVVGVELLRGWLLQETWNRTGQAEPDVGALHARSLFAAECALHLALESRYPHPDEAYLAGLWHALAQLRSPASDSLEDDDAGVRSTLLAACGFSGPLLDVFGFDHALEEQLHRAHPLSRLLRAALDLSAHDWEQRAPRVARLCGLSPATLISLRTDVAYLVQPRLEHGALAPIADSANRPSEFKPQTRWPASPASLSPSSSSALAQQSHTTASTASTSAVAHPTPLAHLGLSEPFLKRAAFAGCIRNAFAALTPDQIATRLDAACWLICRIRSPLFISVEEGDALKALTLGDKFGLHAYFNELTLSVDDETSLIALALRTGKAVSHTREGAGPGRAVADWHVQQWLGGDGLICLPLEGARQPTVMVLGVERDDAPLPEATETLSTLCHEALSSWSQQTREHELQTRLKHEIETRYRDHARRVVHEANNPLTVIKSYLEVMPDKHPEAQGLADELSFLRSELDRLSQLFRQAAYPPEEASEAPHCQVQTLLQDMQTLYGEALFARRGIQFDLRVTSGLPAVGIPASTLKQVLVNLFRNAAEALQPGKRFSVVVPGLLMVNGRQCVEIRVIDNGPGLPAERMSPLFSPQNSEKGGDHQGLGLAIVSDLLAQWQSSILCRSQPGSGTSFQLLVPVVESR